MQFFKSKSTGEIYAYEDHVTIEIVDSVSTVSVGDVVLQSAPDDLEPFTWPAPTAADILAEAKTKKSQEIDQACKSQILGGFTSSALGAEYAYPSKETDQQNLNGSVVASLLPSNPPDWTTLFWCADSSGVWALREHTAAQIQQVGADGKSAVLAAIVKNGQLQTTIQQATTIDDVGAVTW